MDAALLFAIIWFLKKYQILLKPSNSCNVAASKMPPNCHGRLSISSLRASIWSRTSHHPTCPELFRVKTAMGCAALSVMESLCHKPKIKRLSEALRYLAITLSRLDDFSNACSAYEKDHCDCLSCDENMWCENMWATGPTVQHSPLVIIPSLCQNGSVV